MEQTFEQVIRKLLIFGDNNESVDFSPLTYDELTQKVERYQVTCFDNENLVVVIESTAYCFVCENETWKFDCCR